MVLERRVIVELEIDKLASLLPTGSRSLNSVIQEVIRDLKKGGHDLALKTARQINANAKIFYKKYKHPYEKGTLFRNFSTKTAGLESLAFNRAENKGFSYPALLEGDIPTRRNYPVKPYMSLGLLKTVNDIPDLWNSIWGG